MSLKIMIANNHISSSTHTRQQEHPQFCRQKRPQHLQSFQLKVKLSSIYSTVWHLHTLKRPVHILSFCTLFVIFIPSSVHVVKPLSFETDGGRQRHVLRWLIFASYYIIIFFWDYNALQIQGGANIYNAFETFETCFEYLQRV